VCYILSSKSIPQNSTLAQASSSDEDLTDESFTIIQASAAGKQTMLKEVKIASLNRTFNIR
jgi:hypothetical protein